ncbi:MAG: c-type cytochrome [Candidatus Omnitrophica bacterium]|nr:c-type cytochrome [Candidatus Omnitrophota bacterium]
MGSFLCPTPAAWAAHPADLDAGKEAYVANCARCHGDLGDGKGPDAQRMIPRPRDFTTGTYKFRTTASGTPPTDEDLFHTISYGLAGTRMLGWEGLNEETRHNLVAYIKGLSPKFTESAPQPVDIGKDPGKKADLARGKQLYADLGCAACHGALGRANGPSAAALVDDWNQPARPANFAHKWTLRAGGEPKEIVTRLATGVDGTPMPSYIDAVPVEDLWHLAYYLHSIQEETEWGWALRPQQATALPSEPADPAWNKVPQRDVKLWSNLYADGAVVSTNVYWAKIQALSDGNEIVFRIGWDDPTQSKESPADQLAVVFAPEASDAWEVGSLQSWPAADSPALDVWLWSSTANQIRQATTVGFDLPASSPTLPAQAVYEEGRWWLTFKKQLQPGSVTPMALVAWDGGNQEIARKRSVSSWIDLTEERRNDSR